MAKVWWRVFGTGLVLVLGSVAVFVALPRNLPASSARAPSESALPMAVPTTPAAPVGISFPVRGTGRFTVVPGRSGALGRAGQLYRFRVAIEGGIEHVDPAAFGLFVEETYAAPDGWSAGGTRRFQRVGPGERADFTVYLVTPATRDQLCDMGYDRYTSCRKGDSVVINVDRWVNGVPDYGAPLETYRRYVVNHETGHRLGYGHELCPGPGKPAPVMQQQTLGLHGCVANAWPYRNGRPYHGTSGTYPS